MVDKKMNGGCAFGKVTRNMVENLSEDFKDFRKEIRGEFTELKKTNETLYNHLSTRMPPWVTILITIMGSLITGLIVWGATR